MFETSVVRAAAVAAPRRVSLFTLSIASHTLLIAGVIGLSIASTKFPLDAPKEMSLAPDLRPVPPPPLGNPNAGAPPRPAAPEHAVTPAPQQVTAPPNIPETTTPVEATPSAAADVPGTGTVPGPVGQPWGVDGSAGDPNAPPSSIISSGPVTPPTVYEVSGEVKSPVIITRVEPAYPAPMVFRRMSATVVVRCIIGRDGSVREPQVVVGALEPFNVAVINAVRQWKFKPGTLRGQPVDTYLNLTVTFTPR
jgi:protein TonB